MKLIIIEEKDHDKLEKILEKEVQNALPHPKG